MLAKDNTTRPKSLSMDNMIVTRKNPDVGDNLKKFEIFTTQDLAKNLTTYTLVIRNINRQDNGTYQCMLMIRNVEHHEYPRAKARLMVLGKSMFDLFPVRPAVRQTPVSSHAPEWVRINSSYLMCICIGWIFRPASIMTEIAFEMTDWRPYLL
jgi:hypothetical protein